MVLMERQVLVSLMFLLMLGSMLAIMQFDKGDQVVPVFFLMKLIMLIELTDLQQVHRIDPDGL
jgi:hypothetical protein